jgi:hypothetical protein
VSEYQPGAVPPVSPPVGTAPGLEYRVEVIGNQDSRIIVAAGSVTMTDRPQPPVADIPQADLHVAESAWVQFSARGEKLTTVDDAVERLVARSGLAVIAGAEGYGKRAAGIKALTEVSRRERGTRGKPLRLREISPDWENPGSPDISVLPKDTGTGYLLDVAAEISTWKSPHRVAQELVSYGEELAHGGSCLVVIANDHGWPEESGTLARVVARAMKRPSAHRVARVHLEAVHHKPERGRWLSTASSGAEVTGQAAHLLTDDSRPADGVRLADALADNDGTQEGLKTAIAAFQQWRSQVQKVFAATEQKPEDRALLVSTVFLDHKDILTIQDGAKRLLNDPEETDVRTILTGPDLTTRLENMGARVIGRTVTLDHQPGYAQAVLRHLWQQRADIHPPLLKWLESISAPRGLGADRLAAIGDLLVELAVAENDMRVIDKIHAWIETGDDSAEHHRMIARILTIAADSEGLGAKVRAQLLESAQAPSCAVATVVALVCQGDFAEHYPRQALVRLRHILDRTEVDDAVVAGQAALRDMAAREGQLPRVWSAVIKWATDKKHLAGHRAFLSLLDPSVDPYVLQVMVTAAQQDPAVKEALVQGWNVALADSRVATECRRLLLAWAHARGSQVPADAITEILNQIVVEHLYSSPVSALIFGEPGVAHDAAVIDLRRELRLPAPLSTALPDQHTAEGD